ncbi:hypothetical protein BJ875DRAFT_407635 [Amylocarpus encephaloides]|uniref:Chitin-binding type-4 domain-containing protein n=1 Tax=Amylocarpus encephaloides TaxID=45428 RepID=A0A9P7YCD7_9HELO|nr:hypothetical protein BJ875DRAFT_407635 [Amylocarpus encephaloides]
MYITSLTTLACLASTALSHGVITKPTPRGPGAASLAACGPSVTNNIKGDLTSHVEDLPEAAAKDSLYQGAAACNLWLCRGLQFADNTKNVQNWMVGQKVPIEVNIRIRHVGIANVSIIDTKSDKYVKGGEGLLVWSKGYADESVRGSLPANQTMFDVVVPDLGESCKVAGECVLQWWWYGTKARQTYESCIDFVIQPTPMVKSRHFSF